MVVLESLYLREDIHYCSLAEEGSLVEDSPAGEDNLAEEVGNPAAGIADAAGKTWRKQRLNYVYG
jgi:hypothetical protein